MRISILLTSALATAATIQAAPAFAQESTFTGPRLEMLAGYDSIDIHAPAGVDDTLDGIHLRAQAGYDLALGDTWRVGAEAGLGWQVSGSNTFATGNGRPRVKSRHDLDLSLRIGAKVSERTFVYAKGGWANSGFRARHTAGAAVVEATTSEDGWRIGAGVEHMLAERIYAKAEYRYSDYSDDVHRHQALIGVGYRF